MSNLKNKDLLITMNYDKFIAIYEDAKVYYYLGEFPNANKAHNAVHKLALDNASTISRQNVSDEYDFNQMIELIQSDKERVYDLDEIIKIDINISIDKLKKEIVIFKKTLDSDKVPFENKEVTKDEIADKEKLIKFFTDKLNTEIKLEDLNPKHKKPRLL